MARSTISGCNGKMGNQTVAGLRAHSNCVTVAGIGAFTGMGKEFPVFSTSVDISCEVDILIGFSNPSLLPSPLELGLSCKMPMVICTTGYLRNQVAQAKRAAQNVSIFYSDNMSLGVNLLIELAKKVTSVLWGQPGIGIIEKYHN